MMVAPCRLTRVVSALAFVSLCPRFCRAQFRPELMWSHTLEGSGSIQGSGFRKGNGLVLSHDDKRLWMTTDTGSLHVLDSLSGRSLATFVPQPEADRYTESRSSVSLYPSNGTVEFAIYAVVDVPRGQNANQMTSRVIAVNGSSGDLCSLIWSTTVSGAVIGTPVIGSDGKKIYFTHNKNGFAAVTVLDRYGKNLTQTVDKRPLVSYGPPALHSRNGYDYVYWGDATAKGYGKVGRLNTMVSTKPGIVIGNRSLFSSTTVVPTISANGASLWLGGRGATVLGLVENATSPYWKTQLNLSLRNISFPIVNQIELDYSGERIFVSSATNSFHCLDAVTGQLLWNTSSGPSVYLTGAKYSPTHNMVYTIQHLSGAVTQLNADTGGINWKIDCRQINKNELCQDSVEADFSLSRDGSKLYYGDVYGRINAVMVTEAAETKGPTATPSFVPSVPPSLLPSIPPTLVPSTVPSASPSNTPSVRPSRSQLFGPSGAAKSFEPSGRDRSSTPTSVSTPTVSAISTKPSLGPVARQGTNTPTGVSFTPVSVISSTPTSPPFTEKGTNTPTSIGTKSVSETSLRPTFAPLAVKATNAPTIGNKAESETPSRPTSVPLAQIKSNTPASISTNPVPDAVPHVGTVTKTPTTVSTNPVPMTGPHVGKVTNRPTIKPVSGTSRPTLAPHIGKGTNTPTRAGDKSVSETSSESTSGPAPTSSARRLGGNLIKLLLIATSLATFFPLM